MKVTPINKNFNKHKIGDVFELSDKAARVLIKIGKLREVTEALAADNSEISTRTGLPKRQYKRRDMRAES